MKHLLSRLLLLLCGAVIFAIACSKNDEPKPALSLSAKTAAIPASGDAQSIEITTNQSWSATKPAADSWCILKQDGNKLLISAVAQTKTTTRTTQVTIAAGSLSATVSVTQAGAAPDLQIDKENVPINSKGTAVIVTVTTNLDSWSASCPEEDSWCIFKQEGDKLTISATEQTKPSPRTTQITVTAGVVGGASQSATIAVDQAGAAPVLTLDKQNIELDITGAAQTISVTTNFDSWSASRPNTDTWCTLTTTENTLSISATLCMVAERTTVVTVVAGALTKTISVTQKGGTISYEIAIPTDFSECAVKKVVYNQEKIAEICLEYIRTSDADKQMTVIYPVVEGKVDLTRGIETSTGGQIVWDTAANTCTYTPGGAQNLTKVWIEGGLVKTATQSKAIVAATLNSDLLLDVRGASSEMYRIVKIGTQYWMADNLRAERYLDGSAISTDWENNTTGAYIYLYNLPNDYKTIFGALYNGYATSNAAGLAPAGWSIPDNATWTKLRTYISTPYGTKLKSTDYWEKNKGTNMTGFDARPGQNYSTATGFTDAIETWFWSSDLIYDALTKSNSQFYARFVDTSTSMTFNTDKSFGTFHSPAFGHSVRCIRK